MKKIHKLARHMASPEKQSGQAIVLIAMLMIILLASLGLAIDGGGMFLLWRDAQNAADAAAIQAAFAYCTSTSEANNLDSAITLGLRAADDNGFDDAGLVAGDNEVVIDRAGNIDPTLIQAPYYYPDLNGVILVQITAEKPAYFIQLVYGGPLQVVARAISACSSGSSPYDGFGMYSMASAADCAGGTAEINLSGSAMHFWGGMYSNYELSITGGVGGLVFHEGIPQFIGDADNIAGEDKIVVTSYDPTSYDAWGVDAAGTTAQTIFPTLFSVEQFDSVGSGEYWQDLVASEGAGTNADDGDLYFRFPPDGTTSSSDITYPLSSGATMEGLYFFDIANDKSAKIRLDRVDTIGTRGITIVSTGNINFQQSGGLVLDPFTEELLAFADHDGGGSCAGSNNGVTVSGKIVAFGIVYAPRAEINWSGSDIVFCGSGIAFTNAMSASNKWFFTTSFPSYEQLAGTVILDDETWLTDNPTDENRINLQETNGLNGANEIIYRTNEEVWRDIISDHPTCDYINSDPPAYYMGSTD